MLQLTNGSQWNSPILGFKRPVMVTEDIKIGDMHQKQLPCTNILQTLHSRAGLGRWKVPER
jgi:hypothetical protein